MPGIEDKKKVCIIGGGPSGLAALRRVLDSPKLTGTLFEQKGDVGGLWNYEDDKVFPTSPKHLKAGQVSDQDPECVNTMYDNLSTNLPYPLMTLEDFKHTKLQSTFLKQKEMHIYFRDYATHFNLWPHIQLNTAVVSMRPENPSAPEGEPGRWIVETHNHKDDVTSTAIFDAVMICTGKNSYPNEPKIPGLETFQGKVLHMKYFKNPEQFKGKNIVCIGLGPSSADLSAHLSGTAKSITVCHKFPGGFRIGMCPPNVREAKNVRMVTPEGVITEEDESIPCDVIILCTGYTLKFPFASPECGLIVKEGKYIPHLYLMMIFTKRPTLAIFNMCYRVPELVLNEIQIKYFIRYLEGTIQLPSYDDMEAELKADEAQKEEQGVSISEWHSVGFLGMDYWKLFSRIAMEGGIADEYKNFSLLENLYSIVIGRLFGKFAIYKQDKLTSFNETSWELLITAEPGNPESKPQKMTVKLNPDYTLTTDIVDL